MIKCNKKIYEIWNVFPRQCKKKDEVPRQADIDAISRMLKKYKFNSYQLKKAVINLSNSEWWMKNFGDRPLSWFFATPERVFKLLNIKELENSEQNIKKYIPQFVRLYNWGIRRWYHAFAEPHSFIDENTDGVVRAVDFISTNQSKIRKRVNKILSNYFDKKIKLKPHEAIFLYILDPFFRTKFPPPLYYYYSEGLLSDFQCDRVLKAFELMREWVVIENMDLTKEPKPIKIKKNQKYVDNENVHPAITEIIQEWFNSVK